MGGLAGANRDGTVKTSYWNTESTGQPTSGGGTGLATSEMTGSAATSNMDGFDFTSTWETVSGDYPVLAWQTGGNGGANTIGSDSNDDVENAAVSSGSESGGEGLPGFSVVTAVLAVLTVAAAWVRRRTE